MTLMRTTNGWTRRATFVLAVTSAAGLSACGGDDGGSNNTPPTEAVQMTCPQLGTMNYFIAKSIQPRHRHNTHRTERCGLHEHPVLRRINSI